MSIRVAINGFGRIGRNIFRAIYEGGFRQQVELVAINDLAPPEAYSHLAQYDSVHGRFRHEVSLKGNALQVAGDSIQLFSAKDPAKLPWKDLKIDVVLECTGRFTERKQAHKHVSAGADKVLISAPGTDVDATIVYGVNHQSLSPDHYIVSNASCTTNCLAPMAQVLHNCVGIEKGNMTTIHAVTNDQHLTDELGLDLYRARAAMQSMIPTKTGAAVAVGKVLPEMQGKLFGMAVRVPTMNVSMVDLHFIASRDTNEEEINHVMETAAQGPLKDVLLYNDLPLVSMDFNHNTASCVFNAGQTQVNGNLVKVMAWYDNEWGFSNRMLDTTVAWMNC